MRTCNPSINRFCQKGVVKVLPLAMAALLMIIGGCSKENPASGTEQSGSTIAGKVLPPASGAKIIIEQGRPIDSVVADPSDGYFKISGLSAGTYHLYIIAPSCDSFSAFMSIEPDYSYDFGSILLAAKTASMTDTIPSVYDHYPADNAEVIFLPPDQYSQGTGRLYVSVSFDRPMNRASVEQALSISPPVAGGYFQWFQNTRKFTYTDQTTSYIWNGSVMYDSLSAGKSAFLVSADVAPSLPSAQISSYSVVKSFTFYFPLSSCFTDTTYTIKISRSAVDTAGTPLDSALTFTFKTVQSAVSYQDIQMVPPSGDDWVALINTGIQLTFPRRMDQTSTEAAIGISVGKAPVFLWQDYNNLTLYTGGVFVPDTQYTIIVAATAQDLDKKPLDKADTLGFRTAPIQISTSSPTRGQIGFAPSNSLILTFNTYMDRNSVAQVAALVSSAGDTAPGSYTYLAYVTYNSIRGGYDSTYILNQIRFTPATSLARNTFYKYTVAAGAKDLNGYAMKDSYEIDFVTAP
jgi:Bacterial Ig-like domain